MAGDLLGSMRVEIVGDNSKLDKSIKTSKKETEKFGKSTASLGKSLSGMFAGIGFAVVAKKLFDLGKQAENLFNVQKLAETKLDATLKATASAAGLTADELKRMASGLQDVTTFGDEAIIGAESLLLTFKDIGGDVFPRALESILDVSTAMGQDLKSSTVQIGKALNAPIEGLAALSRVGIQFTEDQKELIKSLVETGDKAGAQKVILKELESQFGGVARAVTETADGINKQLNNSYGDLLEIIGSVISEGLTPYRLNLKKEIESVSDSITAHILRGKALRGESTLVENLTIKQIELKKKNEEIAQSQANVEAAENRVLNTRGLSLIQIAQIENAKDAAIKVAKDLTATLEGERETLQRQTSAVEKQVIAEREAYDANLRLALGIETVTDATDENTEALNENTEAAEENEDSFVNLAFQQNAYQNSLMDSTFAHRAFTTESMEGLQELQNAWSNYYTYLSANAAQSAANVLSYSSNLFSQLGALRLAQAQSETELVDTQLQEKLDALDEEALGEEAYNTKVEELTRDANNEKAAIEYEAETASWKLKKLSALASAAQAIVQGYAQLGPIGGSIAAVGTAIATGIQIGIINEQKPTLQTFAQGGIVAGTSFSGDRVPAMVNSGEMVINRSDQASLFDFIKNGNNNSSNMRVIVNLDKKAILDAVATGTKNGTLVIDSRSVK